MATKKQTSPKKNRDENGMRLQAYKRFQEGVDYFPIEPDGMEAMIGLIQNGQRSIGRPPKYEDIEEFVGVIDAYWEYVKKVNKDGNAIIPDIEGFCCYAGIDRSTLNDWEHNRLSPFPATIKRLKNSIAFCKKQLALHGKIPPIVFATDFNNNHGYTQKQQLEITANAPLGEAMTQDDILNQAKALPEIGDDYDEG